MSGGHFEFKQYFIEDIASDIEEYIYGKPLDECEVEDYIKDNDIEGENERRYIRDYCRTLPNRYDYSQETMELLIDAVNILRKAMVYAQRIDWLFSGDDGEETFKERLKGDLERLKQCSET